MHSHTLHSVLAVTRLQGTAVDTGWPSNKNHCVHAAVGAGVCAVLSSGTAAQNTTQLAVCNIISCPNNRNIYRQYLVWHPLCYSPSGLAAT